ncbi:MAG: hypothetical protein JOY90_13460 [Bradyrhizobium sp.]|nr:hypothetical protein [Bradyrhizobium sp.]MBV9561437.1 hypothetical protein [Bradyrhizobium sp.]
MKNNKQVMPALETNKSGADAFVSEAMGPVDLNGTEDERQQDDHQS